MKKITKFAIAGAVLSAAVFAGIALADMNSPMMVNIGPSGEALLRGTVVSVTSSTNSFVLKSWGGNWTINFVGKTKEGDLSGNRVRALSDLATGDFVGVKGKVATTSDWTVNAKIVALRGGGKDGEKMRKDHEEGKGKENEEAREGVKVNLLSVGSRGVSGRANLMEKNGSVVVHIEMNGYSYGANQPAQIDMGSCSALGAQKYALSNVVNGRSDTTLASNTLANIKSQLPLSINIQNSTTDTTSVSCGDIKFEH